MSDWNTMSAAKKQAAKYAASLDCYFEAHGLKEITMTEATTAIFGTSGTGSPSAKRIIENAAAFGYLRINPRGKVKRTVERSLVPLPAEAMSAEDRIHIIKQDREMGRR